MKKLRELLYRDRIELDDLFKEHALWEHLYNELYLDIVDRIDLGKPAIELLNDVYFLCIRVLVDKHPEDEFAKKFLDFELPISDEYSRESQVRLCLACAVLSLSGHRVNQNVIYFIRAVNRFFKGRGILEYRKLQQFLNIGIRFDDYRIRITPASPWELDDDYGPHLCEFWLGVMGVDFSERKIRRILSLYDKDEDRKMILEQIVEAMEVDIAPREEVPWYDTISKELYGPQTDKKKMDDPNFHKEATFIVHGSYIDIHDNEVVNLSVDKDQVKVNGKDIRTVASAKEPTDPWLACLEALMEEKDADGQYIVSQGNHWIAIFRIFADKGKVYDSDYKGFCEMIKKMKPSGFRIPLKYENLKKITQGIYWRPFDKWQYDPSYNPTNAPFVKMQKVAERFKAILEENGL